MKVNRIELKPEDWPTPQLAAVHELLRQRALALDLLSDDAGSDAASAAIENVLQQDVDVPEPSGEECRRWYDTHLDKYRNGDLVHARHILFQVTPGAPLAEIRTVAEAMLMELRANPEVFAERAREKSNCPSGAEGGNLGQLQRGGTVPEFEIAVFDSEDIGVLPKLIATRHGLHIVAVDERIPGQQLPYEAVAGQVADQLRAAAEQRALGQYVRLLAADAELEGIDLNAATSPLIQ